MPKIDFKKIEEELYSRMCDGCENERRCHVYCENCDEYEDELNRMYEEIEEKKR